MAAEQVWHLYMIRCKNNMLYTGITTDVARRLAEHELGKGAKFLRGKAPLTLVFHMEAGNHSQALQLEIRIKKLSKSNKETLIEQQSISGII
ncbi:MAG: GIY-YIG nuclease family protein [Ghiorsea sp.]